MEIKDNNNQLRYEHAKIILDDKSIYVGECVRGIGMGYGTRTYEHGQIDIGKFTYNELQGNGKRILPDKTIKAGYFERGILIKEVGEDLPRSKIKRIIEKFKSMKKR